MSVLSRELQAYDVPIAVSVMSKPQEASGVLQGRRFEVRRSEAAGDKGRASTPQDLQRLFLLAQEDRHRPRVGLPPLPGPVPPPPALSEYARPSSRPDLAGLQAMH